MTKFECYSLGVSKLQYPILLPPDTKVLDVKYNKEKGLFIIVEINDADFLYEEMCAVYFSIYAVGMNIKEVRGVYVGSVCILDTVYVVYKE